MSQNKLLIDVGSTYFKVCANNQVEQHFRDFNKDIYDDLLSKCSDTISKFKKDEVFICSSANGGLTHFNYWSYKLFFTKICNKYCL
jgi:hypothetical protein